MFRAGVAIDSTARRLGSASAAFAGAASSASASGAVGLSPDVYGSRPLLRGPDRRRGVALVLGLLGVCLVTVLLLLGQARSSPGVRSSSARHGWSALPVGARAAVSRGLGADQQSFFASRSASGVVSLRNPAQRLRVSFSDGGTTVVGPRGLRVGLSSLALGRAGSLQSPRLGAASLRQNRITYSSPAVGEWFANGPLGVEQGFTLTHRPTGSGPLKISQAFSGNATARVDADARGVTFTSHAGGLRYDDLLVTDATGARVPARLSIAGHRLVTTIHDARAVYPLRVDPTLQQTAELTASDGAANDEFGISVAVSGSTIVVGAYGRNSFQGAAYVFVEPAGGWGSATPTQAKLTASDGAAFDAFGFSVAVSADGSTVVAGARNATVGGNAGQGTAYVFSRPAGGWGSATPTQSKLTASDGAAGDNLGFSVAVSGDGTTVVAGAPNATVGANAVQGAAYVFAEPGGGWTDAIETAKLTASDGAVGSRLGTSVGVSADGSTVVAGAYGTTIGSNSFQGAAYVFVKPAGAWGSAAPTQAKLTASDGAPDDRLGRSVGVSGDGSTVVAGAPLATVGANFEGGAAYVFVRPGGGWVDRTEVAKLTASDGAAGDFLGSAAAVSADGSTVVAGAPNVTVGSNAAQGAAYVFVEPVGGWGSATPTQSKLTASDGAEGDRLGSSVGVSGVGSTVVTGSPLHNSDQGAALVFTGASTATALASSANPASVGGQVTYTATVNPVPDGGTVAFADGGTTIAGCGTAAVNTSSGTATCQATYTATGSHPITASYSGDSNYLASNSTTLIQTVTAAPTGPTGSTGSPPPSNAFKITSESGSSNGTITLDVELPGAGTVDVLGTHEDVSGAIASVLEPGGHRFDWGRDTVNATAPGTIKIKLKPGRDAKKLLARHHHHGWALKVSVWVTYTPTGGHARSEEVYVGVLKAKQHY